MKNSPQLSPAAVESELNRIKAKPLSQFIDALVNSVEERIANISLSDSAKRWPCRLCHGAGFLVMSGDLFAVQAGKLEPVKRSSGGAIRVPDPMMCPRCMGVQFDLEDMVAAYEQQAQGVAA